MSYFDTHCHLHFKAFDQDRDEVLVRCNERSMRMIAVGTQRDTSRAALELAQKNPGYIFASVGLHPVHLHPRFVDEQEGAFVSREEDFDANYYRALARAPEVVAIGETGLDFYHMPDDVPRDVVIKKQHDVFLAHIALAQEVGKPLIIHCREAYRELADVIERQYGANIVRGTVHCFTGNEEEVERLIALGFYIGFTGVITFPPKASNPETQARLLEAVRRVPLERLLVETDAPYLAPAAYRGKKCEPWMVEEVVKKIAELKEIDASVVEAATAENAANLFIQKP
ncbi:hypothetical protein A3H75_02170 [Candidatus Uhrbacteria bacterium RIFCSPLOWO2_02_FULL_51_9]|uniref:Hydrolase TatD n=1 Tax=Candidatus Uhrbacteria bacterium RIFCSPLOWO2_02_FULL_51_9 TaxID=1802410 RepID=A0A1F7VFY0_9BACT|nr:MAG: hypothetical protein A3H75_02170 [Candidatus Uhrbacteria bacterium RIFCSPLOWO2_02_FULL_51_9]